MTIAAGRRSSVTRRSRQFGCFDKLSLSKRETAAGKREVTPSVGDRTVPSALDGLSHFRSRVVRRGSAERGLPVRRRSGLRARRLPREEAVPERVRRRVRTFSSRVFRPIPALEVRKKECRSGSSPASVPATKLPACDERSVSALIRAARLADSASSTPREPNFCIRQISQSPPRELGKASCTESVVGGEIARSGRQARYSYAALPPGPADDRIEVPRAGQIGWSRDALGRRWVEHRDYIPFPGQETGFGLLSS